MGSLTLWNYGCGIYRAQGSVYVEHRVVVWAILHHRIMGDVGIEHRVVFIGVFGYLTQYRAVVTMAD